MGERDKALVEELKKRLPAEVLRHIHRMIMYGSRARGDADEYSDMDVFVEVELLDKSLKERLMDIAWEVGFENFMVIAPLIFSRDELENSPLRSSPIVKAIENEGVPV